MSIIISIQKAREKGVSDKEILEEIIRQNPDKAENFQKALERGANHAQILEEIIKQNFSEKEKQTEQEKAQALIMEKLKQATPKEEEPEEQKEITLPPQKPASEKQWVRLIIFLILFISLVGIGTFWYWYLIIRQQPPIPPEIKDPANYIIQEECEQAGFYWYDEACYVQSLEKPEELSIDYSQVEQFFLNALDLDLPENSFQEIRVIVEKKEIDFLKVINVLEIDFSELFDFLVEPKFFVYSQEQGNRIGFLSFIEQEEKTRELIKEKEEDLLNIFTNFIQLVEIDKELIPGTFKDSIQIPGYEGLNFRYQMLTEDDFGIFYYIHNDQFIFATSYQMMKDLLESYIIEQEQAILSPKESWLEMRQAFQDVYTWDDMVSFIFEYGGKAQIEEIEESIKELEELESPEEKQEYILFMESIIVLMKENSFKEIVDIKETIEENFSFLEIKTVDENLIGEITLILEDDSWKLYEEKWGSKAEL